jgi:hypothetical protein
MVESGLDPEVIATAVRDAVVGGRFWILTHPEYGDAFLRRYRGMVKGRNPQPPEPKRRGWRVQLKNRVT